jgi:hypothetical protein
MANISRKVVAPTQPLPAGGSETKRESRVQEAVVHIHCDGADTLYSSRKRMIFRSSPDLQVGTSVWMNDSSFKNSQSIACFS